MDVATVRDDHLPHVAEVIWQPDPPHLPTQWHCPLVDRTALVEGDAAKQLRYRLSFVPTLPSGMPVNAHHAVVVRLLQAEGSFLFPDL